MKTLPQILVSKLKELDLEELKTRRQYLLDICLDGNNGIGDDGLQEYEECHKEIKVIDLMIKEREEK